MNGDLALGKGNWGSERVQSLLRFFYVTSAYFYAALASTIGVLAIAQSLSIDPEFPPYDGPPSPSFSDYGDFAVIGLLFFLSAYSAQRNRWEAATVVWWFFLHTLISNELISILWNGWRTHVDYFLPQQGVMTLVMYLLPVIGMSILYFMANRSGEYHGAEAGRKPIVFGFDANRFRAAILLAVAACFLFRAVAVWFGPKSEWLMGILSNPYDYHGGQIAFVADTLTQFVVAVLLLVTFIQLGHRRQRILVPALALALGATMTGLLESLDYLVGLGGSVAPGFALMEAAAFVACATALALTSRAPVRFAQPATGISSS